MHNILINNIHKQLSNIYKLYKMHSSNYVFNSNQIINDNNNYISFSIFLNILNKVNSVLFGSTE